MHTPLALATERARADWLAGDADAWARYRTCVLQAQAVKNTRANLPRQPGRPLRPRGPRAQA